MKNKLRLFFILLALFTVFATEAIIVNAAGTPTTPIDIPNPIHETTLTGIINRVIDFMLVISIPLLTIFIIFGAYKILTAGGNAANLKTGKNIILWAVVGFAIILISKGIGSIVVEVLSK